MTGGVRRAGDVEEIRSAPGLDSLTLAERRVFEVAVRGVPVKEIAATLLLSEATVATHLTRIYAKFGVRSRAELLFVTAPQSLAQPIPRQEVDAGTAGPAVRVNRSRVAVAACLLAVAAAAVVPLSSAVSGPALLALAWLSGKTSLGPARTALFVIGALLIAEALFVVTSYRAA